MHVEGGVHSECTEEIVSGGGIYPGVTDTACLFVLCGTKPLGRLVCRGPRTGHLVLCGALWWLERGLHTRWSQRWVVGEKMCNLRMNMVLDWRDQKIGNHL